MNLTGTCETEELLRYQENTSNLWLLYEKEKMELSTMSNREYEVAVKAIAEKYEI